MSDAGLAFLKCAYAPPDFSIDPGKGIPDAYRGKSFMDKNSLTQAILPTAGNDTYYVFCPTPGVAYWTASLASGVPFSSTTVLTPVFWPGNFTTNGIFGSAANVGDFAANVQSFRYASTCAGLYPTSPFTSTSGSITVWKANLKQSTEVITRTFATTPAVTFDVTVPSVTGLEALSAVSRDNYSQGCQQGMYAVCTNNQPEFEFRPILEGLASLPDNVTNTFMFGRMQGPFLGMGDMETLIVRVSVPVGGSTSFQLRAWSCIEYTPTAGSVYDRFAGISPPEDPVAMECYRSIARSIPVAVVAAENAHFWQTVLNVLQAGARVGSYMPGAIGVVSSVADVLISGIKGLMTSKQSKR